MQEIHLGIVDRSPAVTAVRAGARRPRSGKALSVCERRRSSAASAPLEADREAALDRVADRGDPLGLRDEPVDFGVGVCCRHGDTHRGCRGESSSGSPLIVAETSTASSRMAMPCFSAAYRRSLHRQPPMATASTVEAEAHAAGAALRPVDDHRVPAGPADHGTGVRDGAEGDRELSQGSHHRADLPGHELAVAVAEFLRL